MLRGEVTPEFEAVVPVRILGPEGTSLVADAVIDTGFTGHLTLPEEFVRRLGLVVAQTDD